MSKKFYWTNLHKNKDGKEKDGQIKVKAAPQTHVWILHDGEGKGQNNAPYYFRKVTGDFEASVKLTSKMEHWLDQAGLLVREKMNVYTKVGLEFHDDPVKEGNPDYYAAAYTLTAKDGKEMYDQTTPYPGQYKNDKKYDFAKLDVDKEKKVTIWLKISRKAKEMFASYSMDGEEWKDLKPIKNKLSGAKTLSVGVFAASGTGENNPDGIKVTFEDLKIEEDPNWVEEDLSDDDLGEAVENPAGGDDNDDLGRRMQEKAEEEMMARLSALQAGLGLEQDAADDSSG